MDLDELQLRRTLHNSASPEGLAEALARKILDPDLEWERKRSFWVYLYLSGRRATLVQTLTRSLAAKNRVPFDIIITLCAGARPSPSTVAAILKGIRKQNAVDEIVAADGLDSMDERIALTRRQLREQKIARGLAHKESLREKFQLLHGQRMSAPAGQALKAMLRLYPEDEEFRQLKENFDEIWARDVLANHAASFADDPGFERTQTETSPPDEEMLRQFLNAGEALAIERRAIAGDLAIAFWFIADYKRGLEILHWAEPTAANDWLRAEMLFGARHFIEALDWLGHLETKYAGDPESTFAIHYLRAKCLFGSGQASAAIDILRGIIRVRPNYRSSNALLQEWGEGNAWD